MTLERRLSRIHFWEWIVDLCGGETLAFAAVAFPGFAVVVRAQVWPESLQAPDGVPLPVGKVFEETVTRHPDHVFPGSIGDRKSTRLNSSHPSTSYAVFWLKKTTS